LESGSPEAVLAQARACWLAPFSPSCGLGRCAWRSSRTCQQQLGQQCSRAPTAGSRANQKPDASSAASSSVCLSGIACKTRQTVREAGRRHGVCPADRW
jgi:hypothetical protein